jgi:hypothetical protein
MAIEGVDYSWARPDPTCLFNSGKRFAVRYVGEDDTGENITKAEADRLHNAGLKVAVVYQTTRNFMFGGFDVGYKAAGIAHQQAVAAGMPPTRPIYFALDVDPSGLSVANWQAVAQFLVGAGTQLAGPEQVGVYGGYDAMERLVIPAFAKWGWQTYAWSGGRWSGKAHIQQYSNNVTRCGGQVDLDRATIADYGQW